MKGVVYHIRSILFGGAPRTIGTVDMNAMFYGRYGFGYYDTATNRGVYSDVVDGSRAFWSEYQHGGGCVAPTNNCIPLFASSPGLVYNGMYPVSWQNDDGSGFTGGIFHRVPPGSSPRRPRSSEPKSFPVLRGGRPYRSKKTSIF